MKLAASVPQRIQARPSRFLKPWLQRHGARSSGIDLWASIPRRQILESGAKQGPSPARRKPRSSYGVLRDFRQHDSTTILFILKHWMACCRPTPLPAVLTRGLPWGSGLPLDRSCPCFNTMTPKADDSPPPPVFPLVQGPATRPGRAEW